MKFEKGNKFVVFSAMSFQMIVLIGGGAWGGHLLDQRFQSEKPWYTILFSLLGIGISLYFVIRQASRMSKDD